MPLVNPQIAMSYRPTVEYQPRNALADAAQVMSLQQAQMQLDKLRQTDEAIDRIRQIAMREGGPSDTMEIAKAFLASPVAEHQSMGFKIFQQQKDKADFERVFGRLYPDLLGTRQASPAAAAAATTAPAAGDMRQAQDAGYVAAVQDLERRAPGISELRMPGAAAPVVPAANALAPAPAPVANAMAAPGAAPAAGKTADQLRQEIILLSGLSDPRAKSMAEVLKGQLSELTKTHTVGGRIVTGGGREVYTAPSQIGAIEEEIAALRKQGVLDTDPRIVARLGKIGQLSGAGAPLDITRAMAQRDQLLASGRAPTDPDVRALNDYIRKQSTHAPGTSVTVTQEKAERGKFGELLVDQYKNISNAASLAAKTLPALDTQAKILDQGFTTGFGTEVKKAGASLLSALGVPEAEKFATDAQTFLAATQQAVLQRQLEQKGPQTEADAQRITQTGAQLGNTVNANRFIIDVAKAQLKRDIDQRNFYAEWRRGPGKGSFEGAEDAWFSGPGNKSLFDRPELKKYLPSAQGAAAAAPAIPQAAINDLKAGRGTDAQFDAIFGAGAAKRVREGK